jgi:hypothetical protein
MMYQRFPDLDEADFLRLKEDIRRRGIQVPIELDQFGEILDGHHRKRIADELGLTDVPTVVRAFATEAERYRHVYALNTFRRHASKKKREGWINEYAQLTLEVGEAPLPVGFTDDGKVVPIKTPAASPEHATERQRFHRLRERLRPKEPPAADSDPWEIANEALLLLAAIRPSIRNAQALAKLEQAEELVKQLAWGPESE